MQQIKKMVLAAMKDIIEQRERERLKGTKPGRVG